MNHIFSSLQALLSISKGLDIMTASGICLGFLFFEKGEYIFALISFFFALVSAGITVYCKAKYHNSKDL